MHHDWTSLLRAARRWPALRALAESSDEELGLLLQAPVALAWWIATHAPALAERERLEVVIVCAPGGPACADDGRAYQLVPLMLDRPALKIMVTLVTGDTGSQPAPTVPHSLPTISLRSHVGSAPAMAFSGTLGTWRDIHGRAADLVVLFHPAFEDQVEFWTGLRALLAAGVPVGCFDRGPEKLARDAWLLRSYGYELEPEGHANPWARRRPESLGHGAWAAVGWQLQPRELPAPDFAVDRGRLARAREAQQLMQPEFQVWNPLEFVGRVQRMDGDTGDPPEDFVGLPDHCVVSLATGEVWLVDVDRMVPTPGDVRLPRSVLDSYPGATAHSFEQLLWAVETYVREFQPREAAQLQRMNSERVQDLQTAAALNGRATAAEIDAITNFYGGGTSTERTLGSGPLFAAIAKRDWTRADEMVAAEPQLSRAHDEDGRTPLFHAMSAQQYELARRLLEAGADPDHLDQEGFAVIHDAAKRDEVDAIEMLHRHGASLDLETGLGFSPALIALRYGGWSVLGYLLGHNVDLSRTSVLGASVAEQYQAVEALPRVLRRAIERQLGRYPVFPIALQDEPDAASIP